jgi:hypothetical protein
LPEADIIEKEAFQNCTSLESVSIPKATELGNHAFHGCSKLESLDLPNVTKIADYVFGGCVSLKKITFGNQFPSVGINAFDKVTEEFSCLTFDESEDTDPVEEPDEPEEWDEETEYEIGDKVKYEDVIYIAIHDGKGNVPDEDDSEYWEIYEEAEDTDSVDEDS